MELTKINCLVEMEVCLNDATDEDIEWVERRLDPLGDGDRLLGTVPDQDSRLLWAVGARLRIQAQSDNTAADLLHDPLEIQDKKTRAQRLWAISELMRAMFWIQVRDEFNSWTGFVGIRSGWRVVESQPPVAMIKME